MTSIEAEFAIEQLRDGRFMVMSRYREGPYDPWEFSEVTRCDDFETARELVEALTPEDDSA